MAGKKGRSGRKANPYRVEIVIHLRLDRIRDADIVEKIEKAQKPLATWLKDLIRYGQTEISHMQTSMETKEMKEALDALIDAF